MAQTDIQATAITNLDTRDLDFKVGGKVLDNAQTKEFTWENPNFTTYLGYYKQIPELKKAIDALAMWTAGKGYKTDTNTKVKLERINGWGEDTFQSIMENMLVVKKFNGDAYAEIIMDDDGNLFNIKPLNPQTIRHVVNGKGVIQRYEEITINADGSKDVKRNFKPEKIFHLCNDRVGNEIHGTSVIEACKWVIDARNEAMADKRRILHRSTIRVIEVDMDDTTVLSALKRDYKEAVKKGEVMFVPKGNTGFPDVPNLSTSEHSDWIRYLENFFYQAVGVPKIILGGSQEFTEASSKIGYLTFEQVYMREQRELEEDLLSQLGLEISFERPVSLKEEVVESEKANTGQTGFQPTETQPGRNE